MRFRFVFLFVAAIGAAAACNVVTSETGTASQNASTKPAPGDGADDDPGAADGGAGLADDASSDPSCVADCSNRRCGKDPICGHTCGSVCTGGFVCDQEPTSAACVTPTITWDVDGKTVTSLGTSEATYAAASDSVEMLFPYFGRNVTIGLGKVSSLKPGTLLQCVVVDPDAGPPPADPAGVTLTVSTADDGYADLSALPKGWTNLTFAGCGVQGSLDDVVTRTLTITTVGATHVTGTYDVVIVGAAGAAGVRSGTKLHVHGTFDVTPKAI